jgi:hypothetical protein
VTPANVILYSIILHFCSNKARTCAGIYNCAHSFYNFMLVQMWRLFTGKIREHIIRMNKGRFRFNNKPRDPNEVDVITEIMKIFDDKEFSMCA